MKCIFIGGADRSGTTMLASLLSNIVGSVVTPESLFKTEIPFEYPIRIENYSNKLTEDQRFKRWGVDLEKIKNKEYLSYHDVYQDILNLYSSNKKVKYWIDHSPNNLMYAKLLNSTFNNCYFIHIVRDGRAVAHSQIPLEWGDNTYLHSSKSWLNKILYGFITQNLFPKRTILIKYEDLLLDSEKEIAKILKILGETVIMENDVLDDGFVPEFSKAQHSLVGRPPDSTRAYAWKDKLTEQNIADFQYYSGDALELLGYELVNVKTKKITKKHIIKEFFKEIWFKKCVNPRKYNSKRKNDSK